MLDFDYFRTSLTAEAFVQRLARINIHHCKDWDDFRSKVLANRSSFGGPFNEEFVQNIEESFAVCSTGERALIVGILHAIDYDKLAEILCQRLNRSPLELFSEADVDTRALIACCIARLQPGPAISWDQDAAPADG